jgi:tetratricopeptide (TPR) repeat protein
MRAPIFNKPMALAIDHETGAKRRLILRDALTFLVLILITVVLFAITLFLFRSFAAHREELAQRWSARGQAALSSGHPDQAIVAFRTALSYAPSQHDYELLLAQALGDAGHTEESYNYFLGLWETQPGDGLINLRLARLAAAKRDMQNAINYYRASIYGTWEGDGVERRREVRLELARYLLAHHDLSSARTELLIAAGNAPDDVSVALTIAPLLEQAGASRDALSNYQKVLAREPVNLTALEAAGRLQFGSGNFEEAHRLLEQAAHQRTQEKSIAGLSPQLSDLLNSSEKILALAPTNKLPPGEQVTRILRARDLARKRFETCNAQISTANGSPSSLQPLGARWSGKEALANRGALLSDSTEQNEVMKLIYDTEVKTSQLCGEPTGQDAMLLLLAKSPRKAEP